MKTLIDYDYENDSHRLNAFNHRMEQAERQQIAIQHAMDEHPVAWFVKNLPVESPMYPAIEYLTLAKQIGVRTARQAYDRVHSGTADQEGYYHLSGKDGQEILFKPRYHQFIDWQMPGHDQEKPKLRGCGPKRSKSGRGVVYTACPEDTDHHLKANSNHCWDLGCSVCMNDTAIRNGVKVDKKFQHHYTHWQKSGVSPLPQLGHWVVSPPQEWAKCMVQDRAGFNTLEWHILDSLKKCGGIGGITVFHPWRQFEQIEWRFSPHFHILMYGFIDTTKFRKINKGWVIKKIHAEEGVQSIRHTIAYLSTHMGLGKFERPAEDTDWGLDFLDYMIPGLKSKKAKYKEKDYELLALGKGKMAGDFSDMDWLQWTESRLCGKIRTRYWGAISKNKLRELGSFRQKMKRVCKECGEPLRTYDGPDDLVGSPVIYLRDIDIKVEASDYSRVKAEYDRLKDRMKEEKMTIVDFAKLVPTASSTLELNLPPTRDIVVEGPDDRPDEYYLKRQRKAFGPADTPLDDPDEETVPENRRRKGKLQEADNPPQTDIGLPEQGIIISSEDASEKDLAIDPSKIETIEDDDYIFDPGEQSTDSGEEDSGEF